MTHVIALGAIRQRSDITERLVESAICTVFCPLHSDFERHPATR